MAKKPKLTFFTLGEDIFLRDIIINLRKDYDIKFFQRGEQKEFYNLLHDSDIAWFEFCDQLAIQATKIAKFCKYVCRLHSYEMFTNLPSQVDWNKIDKLIFVNPVVHDYTVKKFNIRPDISNIIYNGVDINKFSISPDKKLNKKIAFIGYINYKKGPELLLQTFKQIHKYDKEFEFYIAGSHQDERIQLYFETMKSELGFEIHMDGWVKDIPKYLEDKSFLISTSLFESFQYSMAEGMACGCIPLVHGWLGSDIFYPNKYIWFFPDECVKIIKRVMKESEDKYKEEMIDIHNHISNNFSLETQIDNIKKLLEGLIQNK